MKHENKNCGNSMGDEVHSPYVSQVETSFQPMDISFHPHRDNLLATALVDGSLEVHDFRKDQGINADDDDEFESLLSSLSLHSSCNHDSKSLSKKSPNASCKCVAFSPDGSKIYTGGSPYGDLCAVDAERACTFSTEYKNEPLWRIKSATASTDIRDINSEYNTNKCKSNPLVALHPFRKDGDAGTPLLATGDDYGGIRIWDERLCGSRSSSQLRDKRPKGCVLEWNQQEDYISGIEYSACNAGKNTDGSNILLATSADGSLGVYDLRMNKGAVTDTTRKSDHLDDELLSLCILKSGKKVVCGTQTGALSIFSWGTWGDISDRFPGHPSSVEALLKVDENTILTGSSDGLIRVVQIHPDRLLGVLNDGDAHAYNNSYPIEKLAYNSNKEVVGSVSHDNFVRLWDATILKDDGIDGEDDDDNVDDEEEENDEKEEVRKPHSFSSHATVEKGTIGEGHCNGVYNSDDEWEDMDKEDDDDIINDCDGSDRDSDSDSDESVSKQETANDRRKKRLKTENERFFDDL